MASPIFYNSTAFASTGSAAIYGHSPTTMTQVAPSADVTMSLTLDLNTLLGAGGANLTYARNLDGNQQHEVENEAAAWLLLSELLRTGQVASPAILPNGVTTAPDGDTYASGPATSHSWETFWALLVSKAVDPTDDNGLSVNVLNLQASINANPLLGSDPLVGPIVNSFSSDWGPENVDIDPVAANNYLAAVMVSAYHANAGILGDVTDAPQNLNFTPFSGFGIYLELTVDEGTPVTGLITFIQA